MKSRTWSSLAVVILAGLIGLIAHFSPGLFDGTGDSTSQAPGAPAPATQAPASQTPARALPQAPGRERARDSAPDPGRDSSPQLPPEAWQTIALIQRGGPYPHRQDGTVFGNRERHLPSKPRGYYREYTVRTPGLKHRGARRIVTGGDPPEVWYYTDDHYESFRAFTP